MTVIIPGESERHSVMISEWSRYRLEDQLANSVNIVIRITIHIKSGWDEKMHVPRWEGQAAYILPTIKNFVNGPTGFLYKSGHCTRSRVQEQFLCCRICW
jgi:hypothetical protein